MATQTTSRMIMIVVGTIIMIRVSCFSERGGDGGSGAEFSGSWVEAGGSSGSEVGGSGDSEGTEGLSIRGGGGGGVNGGEI